MSETGILFLALEECLVGIKQDMRQIINSVDAS